MHIYIVRHGETNANREGYLQGWSDDPLNDNGQMLAQMTGQGMKGIKFDYCISSPLIRAKQTAEIILRESNNNIPIMFDDRIKEINFGSLERIDINDIRVKQFLLRPNINYRYPDGESISMVMSRTQDFLNKLIKQGTRETVLVSTHGCALRAMLNFLYDDASDFWHGHVPYNCCVNIIEIINGRACLFADDKIYYDKELVIDRYKL